MQGFIVCLLWCILPHSPIHASQEIIPCKAPRSHPQKP